MTEIVEIEFKKAIDHLVGLYCWALVAGERTGSCVRLDFGRKIQRKQRLKNPYLTPEQQTHKGELRLFLQNCAWRVDSFEAVLAGCLEDNDDSGPLVAVLKRLVGSRVSEVQLTIPGYDLKVSFENGLSLIVYCDQTLEDEGDNYFFFDLDSVYTVGAKSKMRCEKI